MPLEDEGTDAWRPVDATLLEPHIYRVEGQMPVGEQRAFVPGEVVLCACKTFGEDEAGWVAIRRTERRLSNANNVDEREPAGVRAIVIDCAGVTSPDEFWQRYLDVVQPELGELFGRNLDAFWDAIESGGPGWPGEVALTFQNTDSLAALQTAGGGSFLEGLHRIADDATRVAIQLAE